MILIAVWREFTYLGPDVGLTSMGSGRHQIRIRLWFLRDSSPVAMLVITDLSSCGQDVGGGVREEPLLSPRPHPMLALPPPG